MATQIGIILTQISQTKSKRLEYGGLCLDDEDISKICQALRSHPQLEELELWTNNITSTGAKEVAELILCSPRLKKVDLSNNRLDSLGAAAIIAAVRRANEVRANHQAGSGIEIEVDLADNPVYSSQDSLPLKPRPK